MKFSQEQIRLENYFEKIEYRNGKKKYKSQAKPKREHMVTDKKTYLLYDNTKRLYKIGRSERPEYRLGQIKQDHPNAKLILVINEDIEAKLHDLFKHQEKPIKYFVGYDVRHYREWFYLSRKDIKKIKRIKKIIDGF